MAVFNPQFKINQMAKDMGLKSKEMTDILTEKGQENVRSQRALTEQEFNILMQTLTEKHQVEDIAGYMDGQTCIPSLKAAEAKAAAEKAAADKAAAEKAAAEKAAAEKAAAEKAAAEKVAAE